MSNMEQRFPDLGDIAITILEAKLESVLGKEAIKKIKTPLEKKELREKLVEPTKKAESKVIERYPSVGTALKELSIAEITQIKKAIVAFYENPTNDDTIKEIETQVRVILPQNYSQDEIVKAAGFYFHCLREEMTALPEIKEQLGVISAIRNEENTKEITEILRSIDKKMPEIKSQEDHQFISQDNDIIGEFSFPATLFFVGQNNVLDEINKATSSNNIVLIGGMAGIGKTYITAHFVEIQQNSQNVLWQDCNASSQLLEFRVQKGIRTLTKRGTC
jgi:transcriptional regulator with GAF, ATPase, and Fis domain